mmetsp:Transcript_29946/g.57882  ORF Transcript_29946/g.57882 Transcript_29946/m.57882 type:complete len:370 (+) Transcript_29946:66-1175(+)
MPCTMMLAFLFGMKVVADLNVSTFLAKDAMHNTLPRRLQWPRFSKADCVKQAGANQAQCIPCKKCIGREVTFQGESQCDGEVVNRFVGNCKRDATVLASQLFTPWHFCNADGGCPQGRLQKFRGRVCWAFNKGNFTRFSGPAGVCIKEYWHSRHIPTVRYALANMGHGVNGGRNTADFIAAYQWSMEQRKSWGDRPETVMTCQLFCMGQQACGKVGDCSCGQECVRMSALALVPPNDHRNPRPAPAPAPPVQIPDQKENSTELAGFRKLGDGACLTENNGTGTLALVAVANLDACQRLCAIEGACLAIEFRLGVCELHTEEVYAIANRSSTICFHKDDKEDRERAELSSAEHYFPHMILLQMLLNLHVQ